MPHGENDSLAQHEASRSVALPDSIPELSVVPGGPLFQMLRRGHLADDAMELVNRRIVFAIVICWVPLLVLTAAQGQLLGEGLAMPFWSDVEVHVRLLAVVPMLIGAELIVHRRTRTLVSQFLERDLIPEDSMARFAAAVRSALRLRNSALAEILLIGFVYGVGVLIIWRSYVALDTQSWYATRAGDVWEPSLAGLWYGLISLPIAQFLQLRWYFRIAIWARFLWQVSRIDLRLMPTHPDLAGGLGFLSSSVYAYVPLLIAHGAILAGFIAGRIFHAGASLIDFKLETLLSIAFLLLLVQGPLLVFAPQLAAAKRMGRRRYGALAQRYSREFYDKWLGRGDPAGEALLGSADIQSLADLGNSYGTVQSMRIVLTTRDAVILFAAAVLLPIAPLALTMMPLEELLTKLIGILF
jgi:hypothetical protein